MMKSLTAIALFAMLFAAPATAFAYVGPGIGLSAIGTVLALFAAVLLAVLGFVWYPVKRLLRARRERAEAKSPAPQIDQERS